MKLTPSEKIYIASSKIEGAGRGVFASRGIQRDETIEMCPVLELPIRDVTHIQHTELLNYYFQWGEKRDAAGICLGYGSIYNHSYTPNAVYIKHIDKQVIEFVALKNIAQGEEITVNYNGDPTDKSDLWIKKIKPYV